jgi:hypothetical protein
MPGVFFRETVSVSPEQLSRDLASVRTIALETPSGESVLWDDADFQRRFCGLEISILALSVLDARRAGSRYPEVLAAMLECKSSEASDRLAELTIQALGYYALPDPDPLLIDNEGPIGHHRALAAMAALSGYFTRAGLPAGDVAYAQKNALARALFNFQ